MSEELHECCLCTEGHRASEMQVVSVWEHGIESLHQMGKECFRNAWYDLAGIDHLRSQLRSMTHQRNVFQQGYEQLRIEIKQFTGVHHGKEDV